MSTVPVKIVQDWSGEWLPDCLDLVDWAPFNDLTMDQKVWNLHGTRSAAFKSGNPVYKSRYDLVKTIVSGKRNFRTKLEAQLLRACGRVCMSSCLAQGNRVTQVTVTSLPWKINVFYAHFKRETKCTFRRPLTCVDPSRWCTLGEHPVLTLHLAAFSKPARTNCLETSSISHY